MLLVVLPSVGGILGLMVLWELWVRLGRVPVYLVPAPSVIAIRLSEIAPQLAFETMFTLAAAGAGLAIGMSVGISGAIVMAHWRVLEKSLFPLAVLLKLTPVVAIVPLLVVWLGYNLWPKIVIAAMITFFPVLVNCITGFRATDPLAVEFFESVGASPSQIFRLLRWPTALPYLMSALKITINLSLIGAIVGEFFGADHGIGKVINQSNFKLDMRTMFAAIVFLAMVGVALTLLSNVLERRLLFWHESVRGAS